MKLETRPQGGRSDGNGCEGVEILKLTRKMAEKEQEIFKLQQQLKQRPINGYSPQDVKAMLELYLHWPNYVNAYSHDDYVQRCREAARNGMRRGIPEREVAINLIMTIEKEVPQCRPKFEVFYQDEDDESIEAALDLLQRCDPASEFIEQMNRFKSIRKAPSEHEEYYMSRIEAGQRKHIKATGEERIRICKRQFFAGLDRKPPGIEISLAAVMDLKLVAKATRELIDMANSESITKGQAAMGNDICGLKIPCPDKESEGDSYNNMCSVMDQILPTAGPLQDDATAPTLPEPDLRPCQDPVFLPDLTPEHSNWRWTRKNDPSSQPIRKWNKNERPRHYATNKPSCSTWEMDFGRRQESVNRFHSSKHAHSKLAASNRCSLFIEPRENIKCDQTESNLVSTHSSRPGRWMEELIVNKNARQWLARSLEGTHDPWHQLKKLDNQLEYWHGKKTTFSRGWAHG